MFHNWKMGKKFFIHVAVFLMLATQGVFASIYTVNNTNNAGPGSLREAIINANANTGLDMIEFNIPTTDPGYNPTTGAFTIQPLSFLPYINDPVIIDGYTQPGASPNTNPLNLGTNAVLKIELDGTNAGWSNCLVFRSGGSGSKVRGLVINRFNHNGISLGTRGSSIVIEGNFIGTDVTGTIDMGNSSGIIIFHSSNLIGGTTPLARNIISGNFRGVYFNGSSATENLVQGNLIGTDASGTDILYGYIGVSIDEGASNNRIISNVVSGHQVRGIDIEGIGTTDNKVKGNLIGTDVSGTIALGNGNGVEIRNNASNNIIGDTILGYCNIISGNNFHAYSGGILIGYDANNNIVQGNFIGVDINGNTLGNTSYGIFIASAFNNTIYENTIAFNGEEGVWVISGTGNAILSNSIFSNTDLGIDLGVRRVTHNDPGDGDAGANNLQNFPVLTLAASGGSSIVISGTLNSTPNTKFSLQFFSNSVPDVSYGEGENYLGSATEMTDGSGNVSFVVTLPVVVPTDQFISSTATDPDGNTSEFSKCIGISEFNTSEGEDVVVQPVDNTTGTTPATITFANVTQAGQTNLTTSEFGPEPPHGFKLGEPPNYYDLTTTAIYEDSITVCIDYSDQSFDNEENLKLFHYEGGSWEDRTKSLDTELNIICARVNSFSAFAIFEQLPPEEQIENLITKVEELVNDGTLNHGQGNALISKLNGALKKLSQGKVKPAINKLQAFINQVQAFINAGILSEEVGQSLIDDANQIINQLQGKGTPGKDMEHVLQNTFALEQSYPNHKVKINFSIPQNCFVTLKVYNIVGNEVASIVNEEKHAGNYVVDFNGSHLPSGVYLFRLQAGEFIETKKMILVR